MCTPFAGAGGRCVHTRWDNDAAGAPNQQRRHRNAGCASLGCSTAWCGKLRKRRSSHAPNTTGHAQMAASASNGSPSRAELISRSEYRKPDEHGGDIGIEEGAKTVADRCGDICDHEGRHRPLGCNKHSRSTADGAGVDVAQINANTWAISARGLNGEFSNELLVMVDGGMFIHRLSAAFSGTSWTFHWRTSKESK